MSETLSANRQTLCCVHLLDRMLSCLGRCYGPRMYIRCLAVTICCVQEPDQHSSSEAGLGTLSLWLRLLHALEDTDTGDVESG